MASASDYLKMGWKILTLPFQLGAATVDALQKVAPQLEDEVTVEVTGQPGCEKQQLYFLALAAANGEVRRLNQFGRFNLKNALAQCFGMLMIEFDQASNWVRVTLRYKISMLAANRSNATIPLPRTGSFFDNIALYRGPSCEVVGDNFDFVGDSNLNPGIPASSYTADAPNGSAGLPFEGQVILTSCPTVTPPNPVGIKQEPVPSAPKANNGTPIPSPNPKPPGDNRSRGAVVSLPILVTGFTTLTTGTPAPPSTTTTLTGSPTVSVIPGESTSTPIPSTSSSNINPFTSLPSSPSSSNSTPYSGTSLPSPTPGFTPFISYTPAPVPTTPAGSIPPSTGTGTCCPKTLALIPLVFAALSPAATDAGMFFNTPIQGPAGG
jgi:hypothetical protein